METHFILDNFCPELTASLRAEFDLRIGATVDSFPVPKERFVWDYWNVPDQFTYLRALPQTVISEDLLTQFKSALLTWTFEHLGVLEMRSLSLSAYVEGCQQRPHHDTGHGDWAFLLSLAGPEDVGFQGGETFLSELGSGPTSFGDMDSRAHELDYQEISPLYGRLTIFDARLPHGVRPVKGTHDLRTARLVLQGFLRADRSHVQGGLSAGALSSMLDEHVERLYGDLELDGAIGGKLVYRLQIAPDGTVSDGRLVVSSLLRFEEASPDTTQFAEEILRTLRSWRFPAADAASVLTLPLDFTMEPATVAA